MYILIAEDGFHFNAVHCSFSLGLCFCSQGTSHIFSSYFSKGKQPHKTLFGSKWERKGSLKSYAFLLFLLHIFLVTKQSVICFFAAGTDMRVGWKLRLRFALRNVPRERKRSAQMHAYKACEPYFKGPYACFFFWFFFCFFNSVFVWRDFESSVIDQVKDLPFNRYSWLTTHNAFAKLGAKSASGWPMLTPTNQQDSITSQLNVSSKYFS